MGLGKPNFFEIRPSKYETCFSVTVDSKNDQHTEWIIEINGQNFKETLHTDENGSACALLKLGKYSSSVALTADQEASGIRYL